MISNSYLKGSPHEVAGGGGGDSRRCERDVKARNGQHDRLGSAEGGGEREEGRDILCQMREESLSRINSPRQGVLSGKGSITSGGGRPSPDEVDELPVQLLDEGRR